MPPLIQLEDVCRAYDAGGVPVHALRNVSLSVDAGEMVAIMGASGSGKSTLLNVVGTLDRRTSGRYLFEGRAIEGLTDGALSELRNRKLGFVFQSFNLLARYSALENVELPMFYAKERPTVRRRRALEALERVGLADRIHHLPAELSGGQQQRVAIARALVNAPRLLLADEPTGALDSASGFQIMELFCTLHGEGVSLLVVTHDAEVARFAPRTVTFKDGMIVSDVRKALKHGEPGADRVVG